ncbi:hypothetical protein EGR_09250 [Echinococcus granulosus]|uniref:Uncharacterized protein n=1 Tax=Echinococcus granulosus TaxID=6210 RepID=W6U462_ECHGR|nr:hypothetical protein EGR_09250 [Echinococcus granulosus]EUB55893.1 hypothetical protein EGR_09250 [Echinococcus granulosus]
MGCLVCLQPAIRNRVCPSRAALLQLVPFGGGVTDAAVVVARGRSMPGRQRSTHACACVQGIRLLDRCGGGSASADAGSRACLRPRLSERRLINHHCVQRAVAGESAVPSRAVARGGWSVCRLAGSRCAGAVESGGVEFAVVLLQRLQCGQPLYCAVALMRVYASCASRLAGGDAVAVYAVHGPWPSVRMGRCKWVGGWVREYAEGGVEWVVGGSEVAVCAMRVGRAPEHATRLWALQSVHFLRGEHHDRWDCQSAVVESCPAGSPSPPPPRSIGGWDGSGGHDRGQVSGRCGGAPVLLRAIMRFLSTSYCCLVCCDRTVGGSAGCGGVGDCARHRFYPPHSFVRWYLRTGGHGIRHARHRCSGVGREAVCRRGAWLSCCLQNAGLPVVRRRLSRHLTRLETRTKEFNMCASQRVRSKPRGVVKVKPASYARAVRCGERAAGQAGAGLSSSGRITGPSYGAVIGVRWRRRVCDCAS